MRTIRSIPYIFLCLLSQTCFFQASFAQEKIKSIEDLPEGITSFGGAVMNNRIYVYGGHTGDAHSYYESGQNQTLYSINLGQPDKWQKEGQGIGLQGLAMVAYDGALYRLGGFHAHNKKGDKHDLRSVTDFARFDFESKEWKKLTPMPEARSSFDAVVHEGVVYVIGGWAMNGTSNTVWSETAYSLDLKTLSSKKEKASWEKLASPPFQRRALSVGAQGNRIVCVGGMQQKGGPTTKVSFYDLKTGTWSEGPALPGKGMEGFGSSCFNVGGRLVVSTYGGNVYRLSEDATKWEALKKLDEGRFFHRLLPIGKERFVLVGGASMESGKFYDVEILSAK